MQRAIVTTCNMCFVEGAKALMQSIMRTCPEIRRYCFVAPVDLISCSHQLSSLAEVRPFPRLLGHVPDRFMINASRVFATTVPEEKVVFMDADTLVCGSIDMLYSGEGAQVCAVADDAGKVLNNLGGINGENYKKRFPDVAGNKGCNGGVWGLNTREWADLPEKFVAVLAETPLEYERIIDQPILNAIFHSHIKWLPSKYNAHCLFDNRIPDDVRIIHFTSSSKPWMRTFPKHEPAYWYWLKYGLPQARFKRLVLAWLWIQLNTPKRQIGRWVRRIKS